MSKGRWTVEQNAAIKFRGQLLIAAAAGSGKTAVLVERLINRITDPDEAVDIDSFLVVTFTKAAANEMRERIGRALDEALFKESENDEIERLLRQRTLLHRASITTLHSFCLELIRKHFYQLALDPAFRVADQAESDLLRLDVMENLFEALYKEQDLDFINLVEAFGSDRDDQPLMDHVQRIYEFACSQPHSSAWLGELDKAYNWPDIDALMKSEWGQEVLRALMDRVNEGYSLLERAEQMTQCVGGPALYAGTLQDDLCRVQCLNTALVKGEWSEVEAQFLRVIDYPKLPALRSKETLQKSLQEECKKLRDEAKKIIKSLKDLVFTYPLEQQLPALQVMGAIARSINNLVSSFTSAYSTAKRQRNILDFNDLEHFALQLLEEEGEPSLIAQGLKAYYTEVLVDEYQDINPVQERILQQVSRRTEKPNLFMVGDVKQSIYRFRMADPNLFLEKYKTLPHWQQGMTMDNLPQEIVIDLNRNFRSRLEVVDGVNFLFRQIMTKGAGEIPYDDQAALQFGASFVTENDSIHTAEGPIEVHLIDSKSIQNQLKVSEADFATEEQSVENSADEKENVGDGVEGDKESASGEEDALSSGDLEKARIEARLVSERIQRIVQGTEFQIFDHKLHDFRQARYSDIVILMRSFSALAPIYVEEFQSAEIPVYAETTTGYFGASEVETVLSLLKIIDNPHLDIALAAVLRSPLVGLNGSELGKLRMILPEGDFYEAFTLAVYSGFEGNNSSLEEDTDFKVILALYSDTLEKKLRNAETILDTAPSLKEKVIEFWFKLQAWRSQSRQTSLADLLWSLYEETGYLAYVGTLPAGVQRQANLRVLYDRAKGFEATRYRGLFRFLRFLDRFQGQGKEMGKARALGENEDVVRLITVHASKGLEFPIVFVVGLGRTFNTRSLNGKVLLHSKLGMGMPIIDVEKNVRYPSIIQYAVKQRLAQESLAEELRILYVALTRAKERLFLYGTIDNFDNALLKWQRTSNWGEVTLPEGQLRSAKSFLDWIGPALARHPDHFFGEETGVSLLTIPEINSRWDIQLHKKLISNMEEPSEGNSRDCDSKPIIDNGLEYSDGSEDKTVEQWFSEVNFRLSWKYQYSDSIHQVAKTSVSELKRQHSWYADEAATSNSKLGIEATPLKRPKFLQKTLPLTAAERGTALHSVMQHIPFQDWVNQWEVFTQQEQSDLVIAFLNKLEQQEILTLEERECIKPIQLVKLLNSTLGHRMFSAETLLREVPFTLSFPTQGQANILVQGVIDAVIIRKDERQQMVAEIIDYKTDSLKAQAMDSPLGSIKSPELILQERYTLQLSIYALAIERLLKINVTQCTLYSFTLGYEVEISEKLRKKFQESDFFFQ